MIDSKRRFATVAASFTLVLGGFGAAGCGDDDDEGVVEEAGQNIEEAGEDAGAELDEAGEEVDQAGEDVEGEVDEAGEEAEGEVEEAEGEVESEDDSQSSGGTGSGGGY